MKFNLAPVTLYMTVQLIDRFLEKKQVGLARLPVMRVCCLPVIRVRVQLDQLAAAGVALQAAARWYHRHAHRRQV